MATASVGFRARVDLSGMPKKFSGQHFKRWQQRMNVWFTMVGLISLIESDPPVLDEKVPDSAKKVEEWKEKDRLGHGCILTALSDVLFDVYSSSTFKTTKALWDELDRKYNTEDQGLEKYSVGKFLKFQMAENKPVGEQAYELLLMLQGLAETDMKMPEKLQVMCIIEKLPRSWEDFGMSLKHRKETISLDDLMRAIAIEEEHRKEKPSMPVDASANLVMRHKGKEFKGKTKVDSTSQMKPKGKIKKKKVLGDALLTRTEEPLAVRPLVSRSLSGAAPLRSGIVDRASGRRRCVVLRRDRCMLFVHWPDRRCSGEPFLRSLSLSLYSFSFSSIPVFPLLCKFSVGAKRNIASRACLSSSGPSSAAVIPLSGAASAAAVFPVDSVKKDFRESGMGRLLVDVCSQQEEDGNWELISAAEKCMKKYTDNLLRELQSDLGRDQNESDLKLNSLEKHIQEGNPKGWVGTGAD
ncbi:hypothetical protein Taro_035920 [Colocasia esculenta]|uniref:Uncharacterized protein n=1 Tax=Colocasia esculenta TaxID=4460 RepID=A0A843W854_COLES|nr:hypothetical protein [Colocasia esculenta]